MHSSRRPGLRVVALWIALLSGLPVLADLRLPAMFSDHMVLQRELPVTVWGWGDPGTEVTVELAGRRQVSTVRDGQWRLALPPLPAGGPFTLSVSDGSTRLACTNVLVGEVWVCGGQSNMEWPVQRTDEAEVMIGSATNREIRLFEVAHARADAPLDDVEAQWRPCSADAVRDFSAVGYAFGRELNRVLQVPVGLVGSHWGGTPAEAWMPRAVLEDNPRYRVEIMEGYERAARAHEAAVNKWRQEKQAAEADGRPFKRGAPREPWKPCVLYNAMIAPIQPFGIRGVIWYQGEANAGRAEQYRGLFPDLIRSWRTGWGQGDFPFLCVQLAPFKAIQDEPGESDWAELRDAQRNATQILPNVGMAVITDLGDENDIHPRRKQPVGERLALAARALAYGEPVPFSGPIYRRHEIQGKRVVLSFDSVGSGLECRGETLRGFAICGADRRWKWAEAEIRPDNTVWVWSDEVGEPVAVRYGWADYPVVNLWTRDGLPASPFRTDDFPLTTGSR